MEKQSAKYKAITTLNAMIEEFKTSKVSSLDDYPIRYLKLMKAREDVLSTSQAYQKEIKSPTMGRAATALLPKPHKK
jgi:hypothetical protein